MGRNNNSQYPVISIFLQSNKFKVFVNSVLISLTQSLSIRHNGLIAGGGKMKEIFELFYETRSLTLRNLLIELNIGLARRTAHRMKDTCSIGYQDLFELAMMGLIKAVERYNPNQKYFTSFALPYIKGEIQHFLRDKSSLVRIPRGLHELSSKVKKALSQLSAHFGRRPSNAEVALSLGISKAEVEEVISASANQKYVWSLDSKLDDTDDLTLGDTLVSCNSLQDRSEEILEKLKSAVVFLGNRAIDLVFVQGIPLKEAQKIMQISQSQINALLREGMSDLAKIDICELNEAVQIAAENDDLKDFEKQAGYLMPNLMQFLHDWLVQELAAA